MLYPNGMPFVTRCQEKKLLGVKKSLTMLNDGRYPSGMMLDTQQGRGWQSTMKRNDDRLNIRCGGKLKEVLLEAAEKSHVSMSEQARRTLMKAYGVEEEEIWLPPILRGDSPSSTRPTRSKKDLVG